MRELFFILIVAAVLLGLTAIKYRQQIVALIMFWKQFQAARARIQQASNGPRPIEPDRGIKLVNCARCGRWVPENTARRHSPATFICASGCESKSSVH